MKQLEPMIPYMGDYAKLQRAPYCRRKRFDRILANSYGHRVPRVCAGLVDLILKSNCETTKDILAVMKNSRVRAFKRYDSLALLTRQLTDARPLPLSVREHRWCVCRFREVERRYVNLRGTFPAYAFIVELCLKSLGRSDLLVYVNLLRCRRRRVLYGRQYGAIFNTRDIRLVGCR